MELDKLIKDLKELKHAGFIDCNIQNILDKLDKVTERIVVDKFIADWYEKNKDMLEYNIWYCIKHRSCNNKENNETETFLKWLHNHTNNPVETLVKMKLYGYKVKEEIKYNVKVVETRQILYKSDIGVKFVDIYNTTKHKKYEFTKEELNACGMSFVFDNKGFKVEEVEG
jgi:gp178